MNVFDYVRDIVELLNLWELILVNCGFFFLDVVYRVFL